jgi:hypothetical protein
MWGRVLVIAFLLGGMAGIQSYQRGFDVLEKMLDVIRHFCYYLAMIESFKDKHTEALFQWQFVKRFSGIERSALKRLRLLNRAESLAVLAAFPGNRLEALKGDREG